MTTIFTPAAALGLCLFVAIPAAATAASELPQAIVKIADLDLATSGGKQTLNRRISAAVTRVCGEGYGPSVGQNAIVRECRAAAFASAKPQITTVLAGARDGKAYTVASVSVTGASVN